MAKQRTWKNPIGALGTKAASLGGSSGGVAKGLTDAQKKAKRLEDTKKAMAALHMVSQHMQGKNPTNPFDEQNTSDAEGKKVKTPKSETPKPPGYEEGKE